MQNEFRQIFNTVEQFLDRRAITEEIRFSREIDPRKPGGAPGQPVTARQAWQAVLPIARKFDRGARLKAIISQQGTDAEGTSAYWEFFFHLTNRQAKLMVDWMLPWDEKRDDYGPPLLEVVLQPFPPADSLLRKNVQEGKLLYRQLKGQWRQEMKRQPDLPFRFKDSAIVIEEISQQGLDVTLTEFSLSTGLSPEGRLSWMAQTRHEAYFAPLT